MATRTLNEWDLRVGMDESYSDVAAVNAANKSFKDAQSIIDKAYDLDREGETQQSNIDYTNAKNKAYLDTIGATTELTNAKNRESLYDINAQQDIEKALALGDGFAQETTPASKEIVGYEPVVDEGGNAIPDSLLTTADKENRTPIYKDTPAGTVQRPRTQLERLQEAQKHITNPRARLKLQDSVRKEVVTQAYQLHAFEPDKALDMLRNNGIGTAVQLKKNPDGSFVQMLEGGRTINYNALDAAALVGDVIKGSNDLYKTMQERVRQASLDARQESKDSESEARQSRLFTQQNTLLDKRLDRQISSEDKRFERQFELEKYKQSQANGRSPYYDAGSDTATPAAPDARSIVGGKTSKFASTPDEKNISLTLNKVLGETEARREKEKAALASDPSSQSKKEALARTESDISQISEEMARTKTKTTSSAQSPAMPDFSKAANAYELTAYIQAQSEKLSSADLPIAQRANIERLVKAAGQELSARGKAKNADASQPAGEKPIKTSSMSDAEYQLRFKEWNGQRMAHDQWLQTQKQKQLKDSRDRKVGIN